MRKFRFESERQVLVSDDCAQYTTFGIRAYSLSGGQWICCAYLPDVSTDDHFVAQLAQAFTLYQLDPCHLKDVVLDII